MSAFPSTSVNAATGSNTTSAVAGAAGATHVVNDQALVYHVDLFLIGLVVAYTIIRLPRAFALFGTSREWINGHFLRHVASRPSNRRMVTIYRNSGAFPFPLSSKEHISPNAGSTDDSHTHYTNVHNAQRLNEKGMPVAMRFPPHVANCPKLLRPLLTPLRMRIAPGLSVAQFLILTVYFFGLVYAGFYRSNIFTSLTRTGWIAIAQLPFVFAFSQKNNVLGSLLGYGYEKLNYLHRFAGRIVLIAANIHSFHWFYKWSLDGTLSANLKAPTTFWGFIALLCLDLIFFFSTEYWRGKSYRLFLATHIFGFIFVLPATYLHKADTLLYIFACLILLGIDHLFRLLKSRLTTAHLRPLPELEMTRVEIPTINAGWRAGQHVRLRVMSGGMGWGGWLEAHPFTIASVSKSEEGMVLMVKKSGRWTRKMYEVAKMGGYTEGAVGKDVRVLVEGPYGGVQHTIFSSFSAAVFVVAGSGITFALSVIRDLVQKDLAGESRVKIIELVWMVPDPASLAPLLPLLSSLIQESIFTPLRISVFYTRAPTGKQPAFFASASAGPFAGSPPMSAAAFVPPVPAPPIPRRPPPLNLQEESEAVGWGVGGRRGGAGGGVTVPMPMRVDVKRSGSGGNEKSRDRYRDGDGVKRSNTQSRRDRELATLEEDAAGPASPSPSHFPPGLSLSPGRPRLVKFIEHALQRAVTLGLGQGQGYNSKTRYTRAKDEALGLSGLVVGVCGPVGLGDEVAGAVGGVDAVRREQVGGVEVVEEVFGW